ncbi:MAG TPA: hypothetical protein VGH30_12240 [Jatrophihabitantaceae bacterium]
MTRPPAPPPPGPRIPNQPVAAAPGAPTPPGGWGYGYGPAYGPGIATPARPPVKHTSHRKLIAFFVVGLVAVVGIFLGIGKLATPEKKTPSCPPTCPQPPVGPPVAAMPRYTAPNGSFSFGYPRPNKLFGTAKKQSDGLIVPINVGDGGAILMKGDPANGQSAEQVVTAFVRAQFPDARQSYVVPNALVGYTPGYGLAEDVYPQSTDGSYVHERLIVLGAVKNNVAVLVAGIGPYHEFAIDGLTDGHPSGAGLLAALLMDPLINSVQWKGDTSR